MNKAVNVRIPDTVIGPGTISTIGDIVKGFAPNNILVITDAGIIKAGLLNPVKLSLEKTGLKFDIFDGCKEKPPIHLLEELGRRVKAGNYDLLIGIGGGSVMDSAKIASVTAYDSVSVLDYVRTNSHARCCESIGRKVIPKILVPTTAGTGSEWSNIAVVYEDEPDWRSYPSSSPSMLANKVIIDPELTVSLPKRVTADTGIDALTHAIEAYTSCNTNMFSDMLASTAIKLISENLRLAYAKGQNIEARNNMSIAAALAMSAGMASGPGLVHLMGSVIKAHISHGTCCALLLPAVMEYNLLANQTKFAKLAELMGEDVSGLSIPDAAAKSVEAVIRLLVDLGMLQKLSDVGITETDISNMAKETYTINHDVIALVNCRNADVEDITQIFKAALY